jgi:TolB-like protein/Flp pilus assembly protein TadD
MSQARDQEYFADGISEELLNVLAQVREFRVAGRTSSFAFKGQNQDIREIGRLLNVDTILEGSIRRAGEEVRVTAQLVNVDDGFHLWSDTYDRRLDNIFEIQDEISRAVVTALKTTLLGAEAIAATTTAPVAVNTEAYEMYLKGRHAWHQRTGKSLAQAMEFFKEAIALDPAYAPSWSGLADTWLLSTDYSDTPKAEGLREGKRAIDTAMRLAPDLADSHASLGLYYLMANEDKAAVAPLRKAIELNPSHAMANMWLANSLTAGTPESLAQLEIAREIDPLHPVIVANYSRNLLMAGDAERAIEVANELQRLYPASGDPDTLLAEIAVQQGELVDAVFYAESGLAKSPDARNAMPILANLYLLFEDLERAETMIDEITQRFPTSFPAIYMPAGLAVAKGDMDVAGNHLKAMWQQRQDVAPLRCFQHMPDLSRGSNPETIIADCRQAIEEVEPELITNFVPELHWVVGRALELTNRSDEAIAAYEKFLAISEQTLLSIPVGRFERQDVQLARSRTFISLNRIDEAVAAFQAAVDDGKLFANLETIETLAESLFANIPEIRALADEVETKVADMKAEIDARRASRTALTPG